MEGCRGMEQPAGCLALCVRLCGGRSAHLLIWTLTFRCFHRSFRPTFQSFPIVIKPPYLVIGCDTCGNYLWFVGRTKICCLVRGLPQLWALLCGLFLPKIPFSNSFNWFFVALSQSFPWLTASMYKPSPSVLQMFTLWYRSWVNLKKHDVDRSWGISQLFYCLLRQRETFSEGWSIPHSHLFCLCLIYTWQLSE